MPCTYQAVVLQWLRPVAATCREAGNVPEFYGKPSDYTPGTDFLGTPKDHREV